MSALVELLVTLQSIPRIPTSKGPVMIFDASSTRQLDEALTRLDAQRSRELTNWEASERLIARSDAAADALFGAIAAPLNPFDGIQRGNADLPELTLAQIRQGDEAQGRG